MPRSSRSPLYAALLAAVASVSGLVLVVLRRWRGAARQQPQDAPTAPESLNPVPLPAVAEGIEPSPTTQRLAPTAVTQTEAPSILRIGAALVGVGCLAGAQALLLGSRHPVMPLLLFIVGGLLLQPMYAYYERCWLREGDPQAGTGVSAAPARTRPRALYWAGGLFFAAVCLVLMQVGVGGMLLIFCWLMSIAALLYAALNGQTLLPSTRVSRWQVFAQTHRAEIGGVLALTLIAAFVQLFTPSAPNTMLVGNLIAVLIVPAAYLCGRQFGGVMTGIYAAGLAAVSGWALALGKAGEMYAGLAVMSALYLTALHHIRRTQQRVAYVWAGLCAGVGMLILPAFGYSLLLLPLVWPAQRPRWLRGIGRVIVVVLLALAVSLPALPLSPPAQSNPADPPNPQASIAESLPTTLLLLNLSSDPNPLHGIVYRPALSPIEAAAFLTGLMGIAWRVYSGHGWREMLLPMALVALALPSAVMTALPVRYPDLQRAAGMLPPALVIAALGINWTAGLFVARWGKAGKVASGALFVAALVIVLAGWQQHYHQEVLPLLMTGAF